MHEYSRRAGGVTYLYWYDPNNRCWFASERSTQGDQVGSALDAGTKAGIIYAIEWDAAAKKSLNIFS